ncbi:hypothetical protein D9M72_562930 [compost metagenome]
MVRHVEGLFRLPARAFGNRGMQHDADAVLAGDERAGNIGPIAAEAILRFEHQRVVDEDRGDSIQALEVEIPVAREFVGGDRDCSLDHPVLMCHPLNVVLVAADIGVFDHARFLQGRVHVARQRHRQAVAVVDRAELPIP